jgi:hypothetical protein
VPPGFQAVDGISGAELFDFYVASRAFVKLSTSRAFNEENAKFLRIILMQDMETMQEVFRRLHEINVHYAMPMPAGLLDEYHQTLDGIDLAHL